jgi:hypothetical protein
MAMLVGPSLFGAFRGVSFGNNKRPLHVNPDWTLQAHRVMAGEPPKKGAKNRYAKHCPRHTRHRSGLNCGGFRRLSLTLSGSPAGGWFDCHAQADTPECRSSGQKTFMRVYCVIFEVYSTSVRISSVRIYGRRKSCTRVLTRTPEATTRCTVARDVGPSSENGASVRFSHSSP